MRIMINAYWIIITATAYKAVKKQE
jgi:hypothetical protein